MNIVYVCDAPFAGIGGAIKSAKTICRAMANRGHNVRILLVGKDEHLSIEGCSVDYFDQLFFYNRSHVIAKAWRFFIRCAIYIRYFNSSDADIVHVHSSSSAKFIAMLIKKRMIKSDAKFIFNDRHYFDGYVARNQKAYVRTIDSWDRIICTTENNKNAWLKTLDSSYSKKIIVIPNALEPFWFEYDSEKQKKIRSEFGFSDNDFVIGFSGRYEPWKRWDSAVEITRMLLENPNIKFMVAIGKGSDQSEMQKIIDQFRNIAGERVHIFINANHDQMERLYYALDLFVLTSENESFGRTLIEAMTKRCITIATDSGGAPNVIQNKEDLFDVGDVNTARKLIESYIFDEEKREATKERYFQLARDCYQEKVMIDAIENLYYERKGD